MKKFRFLTSVLLAAAILLVAATACRSGLQAPADFDINEENVLSWESVEGARSYKIQIRSVATGETTDDTFRAAHYSLSSLAEGDYEIRVMALSSSQEGAPTSEWSQVIPFHKNYETGLVYELINNNMEYRISRVGAAEGTVVIEDVYRGKPVTEIGERAFRASARVSGIVIGNNVRSIGDYAFYNCQLLSSVVMPDSVTELGNSAFQGCNSLKTISLSGGLTVIPTLAFAYCRGLGSVEFGESLQYIADSAFYECSALEKIDLPDSVQYVGTNAFASDDALEEVSFGSGLAMIDENAFNNDVALETLGFKQLDGELVIENEAFQGCKALRSVTLPEGLTEIGDYAFAATDELENVELPESLRIVGIGAFNASKLYTSQIDGETMEGYVYADDWLVSVSPKTRSEIEKIDGTTLREGTVGIAASVFYSAAALTSVELPASVKYIGYRTFYRCPQLYLFTHAENGLEYIGNSALANCGTLSQLQLREGLKEIDRYAFYGCTNVYNPITGLPLIPNSVTRVGMQAFEQTGLSADETGVIYAGRWAVGYDEESLSSDVTLNERTVGIADYAFNGAEELMNLGNLFSVRYIGEAAFAYCSQLASVTLNNNLREIKPYTFYMCSSLYNVQFPSMLEKIDRYSFYDCERLNRVDFTGTNLKSVGSHAFFECTNISSIAFGTNIEEIEDYAFYHCSRVAELSIPGSVKTIGERAFGYCSGLEKLEIGDGVEEIGGFAFRNCESLTSVTLPNSVKSVGDYAFFACFNVEEISFGSGIERIGRYAFYGSGIHALSLPESVRSIGDAAFKNCLSLQTVVMYGSAESVGNNVFYANHSLNMFGRSGLTIYLVGETGAWSSAWNSSLRPVVEGCTLSEEGYLLSVTVGEDGILNGYVWGGLAAPVREGYQFSGWSEEENAEEAQYGLNEIVHLPAGTTLYAVWTEAPSAEE